MQISTKSSTFARNYVSVLLSFIDHILKKLTLSETKAKVIRNLLWAVTGKVVTLLGSLLVGIFVARYLGPEQYGLMQYVISYVALFQVFASFGLDNIEIREEAKCCSVSDTTVAPTCEINRIIGTAFYLKLFFAAITICAVIATAWLFEADTFTRWMISLYALSMVCQTFGVIRNYFTAIIWNEYIVKTEISRTIIGAFIKVVLLLLHAPLGYFIAATLFDTVLIAGGYLLSYRKKIGTPRAWTFDVPTAKYILKESFPLLLSGAAIVIYQRIDKVLLMHLMDSSAVGQYAIAVSFVEVCIFIPTIIAQTVTPILVNDYAADRKYYLQRAQLFLNVTTWVCILLAIGVSLLSYPLVRYTYGVQYLLAVPALQVLVFRVVGIACMQTSGQMIIVENKQKWAVIRNAIGAVFSVLFNVWLIPIYGIIGAAIAGFLSTMIAGFFANAIISDYRDVFFMQCRAFIFGWKDMLHVNRLCK